MKSERKINMIKALKKELNYYEKEALRTYTVDRTGLRHLRLKTAYSAIEVAYMSKDELDPLIIRSMSKAFGDILNQMPMETEYDERFQMYKVTLDLWIKSDLPY